MDYETIDYYSFNITVTDSIGASTDCSIEIFIRDVNEAPVMVSNQTFYVYENQPLSTYVAKSDGNETVYIKYNFFFACTNSK